MSRTLEQKNTRYLLTWLPIVLLLGSALFFVILTGHSDHMQEKQLALKQQNIWQAFIESNGSLPFRISGEYSIVKNAEPLDTVSGYAHLSKQYTWQSSRYQLTTYVTTKEYSHLVIKVFATELFVFILLLAAIVFLNKKSSRKLWQPFFHTLQATGSFDVIHKPSFQLDTETGISEFNELNRELNSLTANVNLAYNNQKQFVENASHEIQTPLAIIRSKLDLLINEQGLTEQTALLLADITQANDRLSQLNKNLLLLAKIDNNQFPEQEKINISQLLHSIFGTYEKYYDNFPVTDLSIADDVYIMANLSLIEILFGNIVKNAVVHNYPGGYIHVKLDMGEFSIENTGAILNADPGTLFDRFHKGNAASKTTGLGLSLVKQIAGLYNMEVSYTYSEGIHNIKILFRASIS